MQGAHGREFCWIIKRADRGTESGDYLQPLSVRSTIWIFFILESKKRRNSHEFLQQCKIPKKNQTLFWSASSAFRCRRPSVGPLFPVPLSRQGWIGPFTKRLTMVDSKEIPRGESEPQEVSVAFMYRSRTTVSPQKIRGWCRSRFQGSNTPWMVPVRYHRHHCGETRVEPRQIRNPNSRQVG